MAQAYLCVYMYLHTHVLHVSGSSSPLGPLNRSLDLCQQVRHPLKNAGMQDGPPHAVGMLNM